jgi:hypothetical protein
MAETRRKFDSDFREGAVRLVRETGTPIAQIAVPLPAEISLRQRRAIWRPVRPSLGLVNERHKPPFSRPYSRASRPTPWN